MFFTTHRRRARENHATYQLKTSQLKERKNPVAPFANCKKTCTKKISTAESPKCDVYQTKISQPYDFYVLSSLR